MSTMAWPIESVEIRLNAQIADGAEVLTIPLDVFLIVEEAFGEPPFKAPSPDWESPVGVIRYKKHRVRPWEFYTESTAEWEAEWKQMEADALMGCDP